MARRPEQDRNFESQSKVTGGDTNEQQSSIVADLVHNLNRLKVWLALGNDSPQVASLLLDRVKVQEAAEALSHSGEDRDKKRALEALGIYDKAEKTAKEQTLENVLGIKQPRSDRDTRTYPGHEEFQKLWTVKDSAGVEKTVEQWFEDLKSNTNPDQSLVDDIKKRLEMVRDKYGVEELRGVEMSAQTFEEIENRVAQMKARAEYTVGEKQKTLRADKTAFEVNYGTEILDTSDERLLQVRDGGAKTAALNETIDRVRGYVTNDTTFENLEKLTDEDLIKRFEDVNELLTSFSALDGLKISIEQRKRLRYLLTSLQVQYRERLAGRVAQQWLEKENKSEEWGEVASKSVEKFLEKNRKILSERIELTGDDASKKMEFLRKGAQVEGKKAVEQLKKARSRFRGGSSALSSDHGEEPGAREWMEGKTRKAWDKIDEELTDILGGATYNAFEDKDFWKDLADEEGGIDRIIARAAGTGGNLDQDRFRSILERMRRTKDALSSNGRGMEEGLDVMRPLLEYMERGDYAAAAIVMLEYTSSGNVRENSNDLQFMYVRRKLLEALSKVSPDFSDQFQKNEALGYLPSLASLKPEDFYATSAKLFAKGTADILLGENAFMSGNSIRLEDGREYVISTKTFLAALRSERHQMRIFQEDPNTNDTTIQNILLEEMYGRGAHIGKQVDPNDPKNVLLTLEREGMQAVLLRDVHIESRYASLAITGFNGWKDYANPVTGEQQFGYKMTLEDVLKRDTWMLRNATNLMWYSEMWMDTLKSYQPALMQNTPKALLVAASAIADYKGSFENVTQPFLDVVQKIGDMLGPMERYKAADIVARNVADELTKAAERTGMTEAERLALRAKHEKIGNLFKKIYVRQTTIDVNGHDETVNSRTRTREMTRMAFNNFNELDDVVAEMVRTRLLDTGHYPGDVPTIEELKGYYSAWKSSIGAGKVPNGKSGYMGQEYAAVWQELSELKMSSEDRMIWFGATHDELRRIRHDKKYKDMSDLEFQTLFSGVDASEFQELIKMNEKVTGIHVDGINHTNFWRGFEMEAFVDRTSTKHLDDWEQFAMKYTGAKQEALKIVYKIAGGAGNAEDFINLYDQLSLFATPEEKRVIMVILMQRQHLMTSEQWLVPYEVAELKPHAKSSGDIKWVEYKGSDGKTFFARTVDGVRAYEKKMYRGNYARQVLGKDMWRPHDFEVILERLRGDRVITKHEQHHLAEKILGTRRSIEHFAHGFADRLGIPHSRMEKFVDVVSKGSSWVKLQALKFFLFDDPKYALWTLGEEVVGLSGKTFEHIFGFSVGGGKHGH